MLLELADEANIACIVTVRSNRFVLLSHGPESALRELLAGIGPDVAVGTGPPIDSGVDIPAAWNDADVAATFAARRRTGPTIARIDDLSAQAVLNNPQIRLSQAGFLRPLQSEPTLLVTLASYLRNDREIAAVSRELHVHRNTVHYRLGRIEEILGGPLRFTTTLANCYLALWGDI